MFGKLILEEGELEIPIFLTLNTAGGFIFGYFLSFHGVGVYFLPIFVGVGVVQFLIFLFSTPDSIL